MASLTQAQGLDFGAALPDGARKTIRDLLADEPAASRRIYAAMARKVWSLLIERRFDDEIRDWHVLLQQVRARIRNQDAASAERLTALADLLRESISLAESSPARDVARRPNARLILNQLTNADGFVPRRTLLATLGLRSANLSNVLTQLVAHNLVERRDKGKEAEFRATRLGRQLGTNAESAAGIASEDRPLSRDVALLNKILPSGTWNTGTDNGALDDRVQLVKLLIPRDDHGSLFVDQSIYDSFAFTFALHQRGAGPPPPVINSHGLRTGRSFIAPLLGS